MNVYDTIENDMLYKHTEEVESLHPFVVMNKIKNVLIKQGVDIGIEYSWRHYWITFKKGEHFIYVAYLGHIKNEYEMGIYYRNGNKFSIGAIYCGLSESDLNKGIKVLYAELDKVKNGKSKKR